MLLAAMLAMVLVAAAPAAAQATVVSVDDDDDDFGLFDEDFDDDSLIFGNQAVLVSVDQTNFGDANAASDDGIAIATAGNDFDRDPGDSRRDYSDRRRRRP